MPLLPLSIPQDLDKYFYNREKDIKWLKHHLDALNYDISNQILVTGVRGVGKTYLLKKLLKELPENVLVTYIDISRIYGKHGRKLDEKLIMHHLLDAMNNTLKNRQNNDLDKIYHKIKCIIDEIQLKRYDFRDAGSILGIPVPEAADDYEKLSSFVMEFPQKIVNQIEGVKGFVIVVDEFQLLGELENPGAFFWLIRSYTQEQDNVSYIFTGSISKTSDIVEAINGANGAFGGRMIQFTIDPFTEQETNGYLKERVGEIQFTKDGLKRFYECTRGVPALINSFCNTLSSDECYDSDRIKETFLEKMDQIAVMWIKTWGTLNLKEKEIIISITQNGPQSWSELEKSASFSKMTFIKYLDTLKNRGLIQFNNKSQYKIVDKMLEAWLNHRKETDGYYPP